MNQNYTKQHKILIAITLAAFISVFVAKEFGQLIVAVNIFFTANLMAFIFVIDYKDTRFKKGIMIILFGIFSGTKAPDIIFPELLSDEALPDPRLNSIKENLEIFKNLMIFACSGAGGSIIANHSDQSSTDRESEVIHQTIVDKTKSINELKSLVVSLNKRVELLQYILLVLCVATFIGYVF